MYTIVYLEVVVKKEIPKLSTSAKQAIKTAIEEKLSTEPVKFGKPLQYSLKNHRRLRVGDYRVIYRIEQPDTIVVVAIKYRRDVYD